MKPSNKSDLMSPSSEGENTASERVSGTAQTTAIPQIPHASSDERLIVGRLVTDLLAAGFWLSVNDGGAICLRHSNDAEAIFAALSSTDHDHLIVHTTGARDRWVMLVWGNDCDVISDYHTSLEPFLAGANALAEELDR